MTTREDFRIRKTGTRFAVWQNVGRNDWQRLADLHPSRSAAAAWIATVVGPR